MAADELVTEDDRQEFMIAMMGEDTSLSVPRGFFPPISPLRIPNGLLLMISMTKVEKRWLFCSILRTMSSTVRRSYGSRPRPRANVSSNE
jgi:hypothetical protein